MALQYCQVCGVLIPNAPAGVDATICERCFSTRKLIIAGEDESSGSYPGPATNATTVAPDRVQFGCPSCQSVLALAPVKKRTKIKCPRCLVDFYMYPDGQIESSASTAPASTTAVAAGPQSKLLADLKPVSSDLDELLERVPQKKVQALSSVLDSDRYASLREGSESVPAPKLTPSSTASKLQPNTGTSRFPAPLTQPSPPSGTGRFGVPAGAPPPALARFAAGPAGLAPPSRPAPPTSPSRPAVPESGYELLADSNDGVAFADKVIEQATPPPSNPGDSGKRQPRIATARRSKDALERARREREERDLRAAEASRHTLALMERKRREAFAAARLYALALVPLVIALVFLASTTQETGFATKGGLGSRLNDLGEIVRRGVDGWKTLVTGK